MIGHSLKHDFQVLELPETLRPKENVRDLTSYKKYSGERPCSTKSLKRLSKDFLDVTIQEGAHSSVIDARASLALYRIVEKDWENLLK